MYQLLLSFDKPAGPSMPRTGGPESTKTIISWKLKQKEVEWSQKRQFMDPWPVWRCGIWPLQTCGPAV
jgi:hypothetical protein